MRMRRACRVPAVVGTGLLFSALPAEAHIVSSRLGDFYAGALHPLTAIEDVLPWVTLGLLTGLQDARRARWLVVAFPAGLMLGVVLARLGIAVSASGLLDGLSMVFLGALLALAATIPSAVLAVVAALLGTLRGLANADAADGSTNVVLFTLGLLLSGYAVATLSAAGALAFRSTGAPWRAIALRACGSWIAAIGCMVAVLAWRSM